MHKPHLDNRIGEEIKNYSEVLEVEEKRVYLVNGSAFGVCVNTWEEGPEDAPIIKGVVEIDTQLWGPAPTWNDIIAALYWGDNNIGEALEAEARKAFKHQKSKWRVDRYEKHDSKRASYTVPVGEPITEKYSLHGKKVAHLHISCAGKLNRGFEPCPLWVWYALIHTVPSYTWDKIEYIYTDNPPRELKTIKDIEWYEPGDEPWEEVF